ncbi:hypothetical protein BGZ99_009260, partial [Dissophora globulifera]
INSNSNSQDTIAPFTKAVEKAIQDYESAVKDHIVNVAKEASTLRSFYGGARFKQDKYDYRQALRHDLDRATTAILRMRKHVLDRQLSDKDIEDVLYHLEEDIKSSMAFFDGLPSVKEYDWTTYLRLMDETRNLVKDLARSKKKTPVKIELVKIPEFRTSIFCCSCHFRMRVRGRSVICDECSWERDRDHNAATNMSKAVLQFLHDRQRPAPLDYEWAKLVDKTTSTIITTL